MRWFLCHYIAALDCKKYLRVQKSEGCIKPFGEEHARIAGDLVTQTRPLGLSLGDRACLALGMALKAPVYTADKTWKKLKLNVRIHVVR